MNDKSIAIAQTTGPTVESVFDIPGNAEKWAKIKLSARGWVKTTGEISLRNDDGYLGTEKSKRVTVPVWKHADAPGLMYHKIYETEPRQPTAYVITHCATGLRVAVVCLSHAEARRALAALAHNLDWTQDGAAIKRNESYRARFNHVAEAFTDSAPQWMPWLKEYEGSGWKG